MLMKRHCDGLLYYEMTQPCGIAAQTTAVTLLLRHSEYRSLSEGSEEAVHDEWNKHSVGVSKWGTKTTAPSTEEEGTEWRRVQME